MNKVLLMAITVGMLTTCTDSKQTKQKRLSYQFRVLCHRRNNRVVDMEKVV